MDVVWKILTDVSEELTTSIIRVLPITLMMWQKVNIYQTTRCNIPSQKISPKFIVCYKPFLRKSIKFDLGFVYSRDTQTDRNQNKVRPATIEILYIFSKINHSNGRKYGPDLLFMCSFSGLCTKNAHKGVGFTIFRERSTAELISMLNWIRKLGEQPVLY
jgi:hypothetical protein